MNWVNEIDAIKKLVKTHTLKEVGEIYGVSRQRMYQVLTKFNIDTPCRKRKNFLKEKEPKYYWLSRILLTKGVNKEDRNFLLETLNIPEVCPILGVKLNYDGTGREGFSREENSPSLDQIVPGNGYTIDNVHIISWRANRIKNDGTPEEHKKIYEYMILLDKK